MRELVRAELGQCRLPGKRDAEPVVGIVRERLIRKIRPFRAFDAPQELARFIAPKGSITLDGVSLTVNTVEANHFTVLIIPHTLAVTTLNGWTGGIEVNIEVDLMARYAARLTETK